ncbi:unnamed protein product [Colias eurytheme]|nr:unnamed protein product [Colias eurytheme]
MCATTVLSVETGSGALNESPQPDPLAPQALPIDHRTGLATELLSALPATYPTRATLDNTIISLYASQICVNAMERRCERSTPAAPLNIRADWVVSRACVAALWRTSPVAGAHRPPESRDAPTPKPSKRYDGQRPTFTIHVSISD